MNFRNSFYTKNRGELWDRKTASGRMTQEDGRMDDVISRAFLLPY